MSYFFVEAVATFPSVPGKYAGMSAANVLQAATREQNTCIWEQQSVYE